MTALLSLQSRLPGSACSPVQNFIIPGLPEVHFCAWGTAKGSVAIACVQVGRSRHLTCCPRASAAPGWPGALQRPPLPPTPKTQPNLCRSPGLQVGEAAGGAAATPAAARPPTPLHSALVLDLCRPASGRPLDEPVLHVAYGGGPRLLLAAATEQSLVVCSLERFAAALFSQQTGGGGGSGSGGLALEEEEAQPEVGGEGGDASAAGSPAVGAARQPQLERQPSVGVGGGAWPGQQQQQELQLYQQLAVVRCRGAPITGLSWTQQLDGILVGHADGALAMWQLRPAGQVEAPAAPAAAQQQRQAAQQGLGLVPQATLSAAAPGEAAGPAAGGEPAVELVPAWRAAAGQPQALLSAGPSVAHPSTSSAGGGQDKGASVWWPPVQQRQQQQQQGRQRGGGGLASGPEASAPLARCERLKHPCTLTGAPRACGCCAA